MLRRKEMNFMKTKTLISDFTQGSIAKHLVTFSAPLFLSSLLQIIYNTADMIIVGQKLGKLGLSAVSVGGDITHFMTFVAMGFSNAGQIIISQYIGSKNQDKIGKFVGTMFTSLMCCALIISTICLIFRETFLNIMHTPAEAYNEALAYSTVCATGLVFIYGYNMVSAVLRGMGDSKHPFVFISIASVLNVILDLLFVLVFNMGCMGAALATIISQGTSFLLCAVFLYKKRKTTGFEISPRYFIKIDGEMLGRLVKLGLPMAIKSASIQVSKLFVNSWINSYGVAVSAFAGVANKLTSFSNLLSNSVNTAGSSIVGQNIGAKKFERVPKIILTAAAFTFSVSAILSIVTILFPDAVFGLFTKDAAVLAIGREYVFVAVLMFMGSAARTPANALINGSGNYRVNFATAIFDGIIMRIGLAILFGLVLNMKYIGFWLGDALAGFTPLVIGIVFYFTGIWKKGMK